MKTLQVDLDLVKKYNVAGPRYTSYPPATKFTDAISWEQLFAKIEANNRPARDLYQHVDAAHVDLKGFDQDIYTKLNSGKLKPILNTLKTLKELGVWFEIINLVVPTYTDNLDTIRRMCGWIAKELGPDQPLHFSRFHPQHKLAHLTPTPVQTLVKARELARTEGLHYVYIGNVPGLDGAETTWCPNCKKPVVERDIFAVTALNLAAGKCRACGTKIAGVWG